jgi:hypothetical protein
VLLLAIEGVQEEKFYQGFRQRSESNKNELSHIFVVHTIQRKRRTSKWTCSKRQSPDFSQEFNGREFYFAATAGWIIRWKETLCTAAAEHLWKNSAAVSEALFKLNLSLLL